MTTTTIQEENTITSTKQYKILVKSLSPIGFGRYYEAEFPSLEHEVSNREAYEGRTWINRLWENEDGKIFIPGQGFKLALSTTGTYLPDKVPGTGNKGTYTKRFLSGFQILNNIVTPYTRQDVLDHGWGKWLFVPANGQRGGTTRVMRCFPTLPEWEGELRVLAHDACLTRDVILRFGKAAGRIIGVGSLRVGNGGQWGMFDFTSVEEIPLEF